MDGTETRRGGTVQCDLSQQRAVSFEEALDADADLLDALGPYVPHFRFVRDDLSMPPDADQRGRC